MPIFVLLRQVTSASTILLVHLSPTVSQPTPKHSSRQPQPQPQRLVAEAPIWGKNDGNNGYAFLPVTLQGKKAIVVINLNCTRCDLEFSTAALTL